MKPTLVLLLTMTLLAQDPDGGAGRGRPLAAYRPAVPGVKGLVTAGHPLAAMAGMQVLQNGGNAMDAAVAVGAVLTMMEPQMNGIGGNGFLTYYDKKTGKVHSLAMAGAAPRALKPEAITEAELSYGIKAGIVPGNFGGYLEGAKRFGTLPLSTAFAAAIDYADSGYPMDASLATAIGRSKSAIEKYPTTAKVFLPSGVAPKAGDRFRNPDLAATLRKTLDAERAALKKGKSRADAIQAAFDRFYKGDIAQEFDRFFRKNQGLLTAADLAAYQPQWGEPVHTTYRGYDVYSSHPSSRGGLEVTMALNLIEPFDIARMGAGSAEALHLLIEAIKVSKADIYRYVADPKAVKVPVSGLVSKRFADERRKLIATDKAGGYPEAGEMEQVGTTSQASAGPMFPEHYESERDTTSFSIVDQFGNAVACTPTLGGGFGNGVVVGNTGLLLNNGMRLGATSPYPDTINYVKGGQVPLLNNSPTIVLKDGKLVMAFGTPGGEGIGQTEFQMIVNVLDFGMPVQQAIEAPRFILNAKPNFYKPGSEISIVMERRVPPATVKTLEGLGHRIAVTSDFTAAVGGMQGIVIDHATGAMFAGADPRRTGYAVGW
jgi:gamma-glutamyltranspeptidase/glutathione hydrolase